MQHYAIKSFIDAFSKYKTRLYENLATFTKFWLKIW